MFVSTFDKQGVSVFDNLQTYDFTSNKKGNIMEDETFDYLFKIVMIGDCGVGKTCVVQRFKSGTYVERHGNTIGVDFAMRTLTVNKKRVKVSRSISLEWKKKLIYIEMKFYILKSIQRY